MLHDLDEKSSAPKVSVGGKTDVLSTQVVAMVVVGAIILGVGSGFIGNMIASGMNFGSLSNSGDTTSSDSKKESAGVMDKKTFPDSAQGLLKEGGMEGEGSYHLERPGGKSQNVYLTSTAVDLSIFVGKKVKVWGQTFAAEKAGWLMDVGYIEVTK